MAIVTDKVLSVSYEKNKDDPSMIDMIETIERRRSYNVVELKKQQLMAQTILSKSTAALDQASQKGVDGADPV